VIAAVFKSMQLTLRLLNRVRSAYYRRKPGEIPLYL